MGAVYVIYNLLLAVALLASAPYWFVRLLRQGKYREGIGNRLGVVPTHLAFLGRGRQAGDLGACGVGWRNSCRGRTHPGNAETFRGLRDCHLHDHQHRPQVGGRALRPGECFLLPARSQFCRSPLHAPASAKAGGDCRNRVLAQLSADRAPLRRGGCGGECAHFRPFVSTLPKICLPAAPRIAERGSLPGADRRRRRAACRHRRRASTA